MAKVWVAFRVKPGHYRALKRELSKGKSLTGVFEELLDEKFPVTSRSSGL